MYLVQYVNDDEIGTLLDQRLDIDLISAELTLGYNIAGSLAVSMPYYHEHFNKIHELITLIKVFKINGGKKEWLFTGRVITADEDFYRTGTFICEGILAVLCDSIVRNYEFQGTPIDYVKQLINQHNSQVTEDKQFTIRTLDIMDVDSNNNIVRANSQYPNTMNELSEKVIKALDVYVSVEENDGKYMIDFMQSISAKNQQNVELGENIINLTKSKAVSDIKTVIIPLGYEDEDGNKLTISSVNEGRDFIYDQDAVNQYGVIVGVVEFEDVTLPENLLRKGSAYLKECVNSVQTIQINAVDLSCGIDIESIRLGWIHTKSLVHCIDTDLLLTEMHIDLLDPANNIYTLGNVVTTVTSMNMSRTREISREIQRVRTTTSKKIESAVDNATQLITGAKGGFVVLDGDNNGYPERILIMDNADKTLAQNVIQINKNGIGFSTTGINGPYANAWTIDGNLVADFITAGTMFADRIRGGTLEIGGEKDGVITVLDEDGNTVATINKDGVDVLKGSVRGSTITVGGTNNSDGTITVLDAGGNTVATINKDGVDVLKGSIKGVEIVAGGSNNTDGKICIKDASGAVKITIDVNGINVNDKFKVDMNGNMEAISISGDAVEQISDIIDASDAMKTAKRAINTAQSAAETAQKTAETANSAAETARSAASTAQSAAETAQSAANTAQKTADTANTTVTNLNKEIIPEINKWIGQLSVQIRELGKPGIS